MNNSLKRGIPESEKIDSMVIIKKIPKIIPQIAIPILFFSIFVFVILLSVKFWL